ncbi:MAG: hypothetical protein AB7F53_06615 [Nitrososphaeraceae archaeon]
MVQKHQNRKDKVKDGIDFLLSHFEGRQRLFPRKMSTFASNGKQFIVYNREQILQSCRISQFKDCRLSVYTVLEEGLLQTPNIIFIDLDLPTGSQDYQDNLKELEKNLDKL